MRHDPSLTIRGQMLSRIEALQDDCSRLSLNHLCDKLEDIRSFARRNGFSAIERLASLLESVVAYNGHRQIALTYLTLMKDAADDGADSGDAARVYLAAAALRGCR